jgi:predicted ATPase
MKIKSIKIKNLQGRKDINMKFNDDINIITGVNGAGKTTIIKLVWYLVSGNVERVHKEVDFDLIYLRTTKYDLKIENDSQRLKVSVKISKNIFEYVFFKSSEGLILMNDDETSVFLPKNVFEFKGQPMEVRDIDGINRMLVGLTSGSVFFPTFRRVEGGYSLSENLSEDRFSRQSGAGAGLQAGLVELSSKLSVYDNLFVASISTHDITELLRRKHSDTSEKVNSLHIGMSEYIEKKIEGIRGNSSAEIKDKVLNDIQVKVADISSKREELLSPFTTLSTLIGQIFQNRGIKFTDKFSVGTTEKAISSAKMSAGEKQLLSFICYNAFYENVPFIIDEPELSLHVDWQRNLLRILKSQKTGNQIIIATHSPFIYSKFPEKEININA